MELEAQILERIYEKIGDKELRRIVQVLDGEK